MKPSIKPNMKLSAALILPILLLLSSITLSVYAGVEVREFTDAEQERRYHKLIDELRCLVCQNQNLADSNSQLALDLRNKVFEMLAAEKTDQQVADYMVQRYGEYVLYNPPLDPVTSILWIGPILAVIAAILLLLIFIFKLSKTTPVTLSDEDRAKTKNLLDQKGDDE